MTGQISGSRLSPSDLAEGLERWHAYCDSWPDHVPIDEKISAAAEWTRWVGSHAEALLAGCDNCGTTT